MFISVHPWFHSFCIATKKMLADYELPQGATTVAMTGDGKTIFYARGSTLYAIAFKAAFGVEPL